MTILAQVKLGNKKCLLGADVVFLFESIPSCPPVGFDNQSIPKSKKSCFGNEAAKLAFWQKIRFAEKLNADYTRIHILVPLKNTKIFEMVEDEELLNERYDHFNQKATWKAGAIESRNYTSNDLTILKAMEWDRLNFSDPAKRKKICDWLRVTEEELLVRRRQTIDSIYKNMNQSTKAGAYKDSDRKEFSAATFERVPCKARPTAKPAAPKTAIIDVVLTPN